MYHCKMFVMWQDGSFHTHSSSFIVWIQIHPQGLRSFRVDLVLARTHNCLCRNTALLGRYCPAAWRQWFHWKGKISGYVCIKAVSFRQLESGDTLTWCLFMVSVTYYATSLCHHAQPILGCHVNMCFRHQLKQLRFPIASSHDAASCSSLREPDYIRNLTRSISRV